MPYYEAWAWYYWSFFAEKKSQFSKIDYYCQLCPNLHPPQHILAICRKYVALHHTLDQLLFSLIQTHGQSPPGFHLVTVKNWSMWFTQFSFCIYWVSLCNLFMEDLSLIQSFSSFVCTPHFLLERSVLEMQLKDTVQIKHVNKTIFWIMLMYSDKRSTVWNFVKL